MNQNLREGETGDVTVTLAAPTPRRFILEIRNGGPERRLFQMAEEVREYLAEEKAAWDRWPFLPLAWSISMPAVSSTAWSG